jgi:hypothetical protein
LALTRSRLRVCRWDIIFLCLAAALGVSSAEQSKKKEKPFAVVAGTVFRDPGFALAGAEVVLEPGSPPPAEGNPAAPASSKKVKVKRMTAVSDRRGEFAFRVPAEPMRYHVSVKAAGLKPDRKEVIIQGEERQDVFFKLEPASQ